MKRFIAFFALLVLLLCGGCSKAEAPEESGVPEQDIAPQEPEEPDYGPNEMNLREIKRDGYVGYILEISNPAWVRLGVPFGFGEKGQKIPLIIEDYAALAGINGGGFADAAGWGNGGTAIGTVIVDGKMIQETGADRSNIIGFNYDNELIVGDYAKEEVADLNLRDACEFFPVLIKDGEAVEDPHDHWGRVPRTAIGQREDGTVLFVVIDGRQEYSKGATIKQLQKIMVEEKAYNAANLDGGSSTVLYYEDSDEEDGIVNRPCGSDSDGMRFLPNAWLVIDPHGYEAPQDRPPHNE